MADIATPVFVPVGWDDLRPLINRRLDLGIAQGIVAAAMGCAQSYVCAMERGRVGSVTPEFLQRYASALALIEGGRP